MSDFLNRISKLSPQRLALLADELNERVQAAERCRRVPLAIVGIGCRLPGEVRNAEAFWNLLSEGVDAVGEVPLSRWDIEDFYDRNPDTPGKMATRWGGFIDSPDQFDPQFFGVAPAEAASMDPQQRLLLETSWEALEHAGIAASSLAGSLAGVFIGICNGDYGQIALNCPREKITPYFAPGLSHAVAAGRISYVLGLQGPSMAVDTSCSASLVAVHLACQSLRLNECNVALAGGVNLILNPDITIALSQSRMMAPDGRCKAFSDSANGFVRGEGCGVVVLKRLPDALCDRNRILAVIRGSACNQDGRSSGLTAPYGPSQEAVITAALADAGLRPADVDYIEAHGTGTALGDPIEIGALNAVFADRSAEAEPLFVGSVKTNLGHLEPAAGIAGLIKLVLSIQHGQIPPSLHFDTPNHRMEWDRLPIEVPTALQTWKRRGEKRVGGVSSFGFSGTNAHVVVEEYIDKNSNRPPSITAAADLALLFPLSAKTESALRTMAARLQRHLEEHPSLPLADVAHTLNSGRSRFEHRMAITAASRTELLDSLSSFGVASDNPAVQVGRARAHSPRLAFIFSGYENFGCELYEHAPAFREAIQRCEQILSRYLDEPLTSLLYSQSRDGRHRPKAGDQAAASFALQYALAELWRACGIEPHAVVGQGVGEFVAACTAGIFRLEDGLRLAIAVGKQDSAELAQSAHQIQYRSPQIVFISNRDDSNLEVNSPEFWLRRSDALLPQALSSLAQENCAANIVIGDDVAFQGFVHGPGKRVLGKSLPAGSDSCLEFLHAAGAIYVLGCDLDADGLYRDQTMSTVSLPTYPFQRERYWLDECRPALQSKQRETAFPVEATLATSPEDWIYDLVWEPRPLPETKPQQLGAGFDANLLTTFPVRSADAEMIDYSSFSPRLEPVCTAYIVNALHQLGADALPDRALTLDEVGQRLHVAASRRRLFERLFAILVEDGLAEKTGDGFRLTPRFAGTKRSPEPEMRTLQAAFPLCRTEMNVLARCGENLGSVLAGEIDPVHLLFPNNSMEETEHIYRNSPMARYYNESIADLVRSAVDRASGRAIHILEIGAGTGATTAAILRQLAGKNVEYTFTDISPAFLARARTKFAGFPGLHCRVLNIENDPVGQGFEPGSFDIVVAANVLHATVDLRGTIAHMKELLASSGISLLLEGMRPDRGVDLTFGLTDGWWRFADHDVRPDYPLVAADTWMRLLQEAGMASTRVITYPSGGQVQPSHQMVVIAQTPGKDGAGKRKPPVPRQHYLIFADESGVGAALNTLLINSGGSCETIYRTRSNGAALSRLGEILSRSSTTTVKIVYLWGMDVFDPGGSPGILVQDEELCVKTPVHIIQSMLQRPVHAACLWMVTCGSQPTSSFSPAAAGAIQSMVWGVGRVFGLENPERYGRMIDLDPGQSAQQAADAIFAELGTDDLEDQIAYRDGQRLAVRLRNSSLEASSANSLNSIRLRKDSAYLITGGLGGIGLRFSRWAASQGAGHLVLLSRSGAGSNAGAFAAERLQAIQEIRELGADVTVVEGDVTSEHDMKLLFRRFSGELPPLRGIVHAATALSNQELGSLTDQQIESMLAPKVRGTWLLHMLTKNVDLDFFLAFSSAASVLGGRGMAHYAAANLFLDSFAHVRRALGLPMLAINWGAWDVMRRFSREDRDRFTQIGLLPMDSQMLFQLIGKLIQSPRAQVMVANVDWQVMKPALESNRVRPMLEKMAKPHSIAQPAASEATLTLPRLQAAAGMMPDDRRKFIEAFVLEQAARVLGFRRGELPPVDVPLTDLGLDSLMAVDLKNHLQTGLGQQLSPTIVFDYSTVSDMVGVLETMLWASRSDTEDNLASVHKDEIYI